MTDFTSARKNGIGIQITSSAMWDEYQDWCLDQECEKCGAKYADRPKNGDTHLDIWATETLCGKCCFGENYEKVLSDLNDGG